MKSCYEISKMVITWRGLRNICLPEDYKELFFFRLFFFTKVVVWACMFRSAIHLELIFVYGVQWGSAEKTFLSCYFKPVFSFFFLSQFCWGVVSYVHLFTESFSLHWFFSFAHWFLPHFFFSDLHVIFFLILPLSFDHHSNLSSFPIHFF